MTKKEFGNFSQWTLKELIEAERSFVAGDQRKAELQAEIDRRAAAQDRRAKPIYLFLALLSGLAALVTIAGFNRGIYLGSTTTTYTQPPIGGTQTTIIHKVCRYLFITGIAELPARGGHEGYAFTDSPEAKALHCRFFAE